MFCNNFYKLISRFPTIFKTIPTSYLDSLSYEDQLNWLCAIILELKDQIANIDFDVDISTDPIIIEIQQNIQQLQTAIEQTNQNVQGLQQGIASLGQQLHSLTNRVSALEQNYGVLENSSIIVSEVEIQTTV